MTSRISRPSVILLTATLLASCGNDGGPTGPAASAVVILTQPSSTALNGVPFLQQPVIQLKDEEGEDVPRAGIKITVTISSGTGSVGGTVTRTTDADGRVAFADLAVVGEGSHALLFTAGSIPPATSTGIIVATPVQNNVPLGTLSGAQGSARLFVIEVPPGAGLLDVRTAGGGGDPDILLRRYGIPTAAFNHCSSNGSGTEERCSIGSPLPGTWYIAIQGSAAYAGLSLTALHVGATHLVFTLPPADTARSGVPFARQPVLQLRDTNDADIPIGGLPVTTQIASGGGLLHGVATRETDAGGQVIFTDLSITGGGDQTLRFTGAGAAPLFSTPVALPSPLTNGAHFAALSGSAGSTRWYAITIPAGVSELALSTVGGSGNVDIYLRHGGLPTPGVHGCAAQSGGNAEQCLIADPTPGTWYALLLGSGAYDGVDLDLTLTAPGSCSLISVGDADGDRLPDCTETHTGTFAGLLDTGTDPNDPDTDHDGLSDGDEVLGTTLGLDLPALGTSPVHRDLLMEFDWFEDALECGSHSHRPTPNSIMKVQTAMALAPLPNPDGTTGVHIIADYGQGGVFTGGNLVPDGDGVLTYGVGAPEFLAIKEGNLAGERRGYFHYTILPHRYFTTSASSGQAELPGDDMIVSLYCAGSDQNVANTIMHELGHNLALRHGGDVDVNYKPNYNSVMNYLYQFPGVDNNCTPPGDGVLAFSTGLHLTLDERDLHETDGICGSPPGIPVDWDSNGEFGDVVPLSADINRNPSTGVGDRSLSVLYDFDDWNALVLYAVRTGAMGAARLVLPQEVVSCSEVPRK